VRVGIIGRGFGERVVAAAFNATEGCEVVDVITPRDEAAVAALCGRADVDLISVHPPPFLHVDHVRLARRRRQPPSVHRGRRVRRHPALGDRRHDGDRQSSSAPVNLTPTLVVVASDGVLEAIADSWITLHTQAGSEDVFTREGGGNSLFQAMQTWACVVRDAVHDGEVDPDAPTFADGLAWNEVLDRLRG